MLFSLSLCLSLSVSLSLCFCEVTAAPLVNTSAFNLNGFKCLISLGVLCTIKRIYSEILPLKPHQNLLLLLLSKLKIIRWCFSIVVSVAVVFSKPFKASGCFGPSSLNFAQKCMGIGGLFCTAPSQLLLSCPAFFPLHPGCFLPFFRPPVFSLRIYFLPPNSFQHWPYSPPFFALPLPVPSATVPDSFLHF